MRNYFSEMGMINEKFPLSIGEEMVRNERTLLSKVEDGKMMMSADSVRFLVLHCSATRRNQDYSVDSCDGTIRVVVSMTSDTTFISVRMGP